MPMYNSESQFRHQYALEFYSSSHKGRLDNRGRPGFGNEEHISGTLRPPAVEMGLTGSDKRMDANINGLTGMLNLAVVIGVEPPFWNNGIGWSRPNSLVRSYHGLEFGAVTEIRQCSPKVT